MFDLDHHDLAGHHWKGLHRMRSSGPSFEPLGKHPGVGPKITKALLELGLIEVGHNPQRPDLPGYRVSALGFKVLSRGPYAQRRTKHGNSDVVQQRIATESHRCKFGQVVGRYSSTWDMSASLPTRSMARSPHPDRIFARSGPQLTAHFQRGVQFGKQFGYLAACRLSSGHEASRATGADRRQRDMVPDLGVTHANPGPAIASDRGRSDVGNTQRPTDEHYELIVTELRTTGGVQLGL